MTQILNLDKIQTKKDKAIILNGKEHVMKTLTVKEYIYHMREAERLAKLDETSIDTLAAGLEATINILSNAFPTVAREEFEALQMDQLDLIRTLVDGATEEDTTPEGEAKGEKVAD